MKKLTGILVVLFLMICSLAAAAGPEQVKDSVIDVTDKDGLILKVQWPVFSSKDDSHGHLIASLKKESDQLRSFFDKDMRESKELAAKGHRDIRNSRWLVFVKLERDDARVLSLLEQSFHLDLAGERWGYEGLNYDAKTGKKLSSLDVFKLSVQTFEGRTGRYAVGKADKEIWQESPGTKSETDDSEQDQRRF